MLTYLYDNKEVILPSNVFEVLTSNIFKPFYVVKTPERDIKQRWFNLNIGETRLRVTFLDGTVSEYTVVDCSSESTIRRFCTKHNIYEYKKITLDTILTYRYDTRSKKYIKEATCVRFYNTPSYLITESFINEVICSSNSGVSKLEEYRMYNFGKPNEWKLILG